jgi:hypothetical protein
MTGQLEQATFLPETLQLGSFCLRMEVICGQCGLAAFRLFFVADDADACS